MVQGTEYMTFLHQKSISEKNSAGMDTNNNEHADELNQTIVHLDTRDTLTFIQANALDMDDEAEDTSLTSVKSIITTDQQKNTDKVPVVDMVEFHNHEQFSRLESTLTKSIVGINNQKYCWDQQSSERKHPRNIVGDWKPFYNIESDLNKQRKRHNKNTRGACA